jgi:hypothetical protein
MYEFAKAVRLRQDKEPVGRDQERHDLQRPTLKLETYIML